MKYIISSFLAFTFLFSASLTAQDADIYAVKLGQFINAKASAFSVVEDLGYLYAVKDAGTVKNVYIGGIKGKAEADRVVKTAQSRGYIDAQAENLTAKNAETTTVIQLAVRDARKEINWKEFSSAGRIFALVNGNQLKIVAGPYPDAQAAKAILPTVQRKGFSDAFVKNVSSALLHEVTPFESGDVDLAAVVPQPTKSNAPANTPAPAEKTETAKGNQPEEYAEDNKKMPTVPSATKKSVPAAKTPAVKVDLPVKRPAKAPVLTAPKPAIRKDVKRTSVLRLQEILKAEGTYNSSLDGFYGGGTKAAYEASRANNRQMIKYRALADYAKNSEPTARPGSLQYAVNGLWDDPKNAVLTLERSNAPVAKAYRAYWLHETTNNQAQVDALMAEAVREAFVGKKIQNAPQFDYKANYSYKNLDQLLQHLSYVQSADKEKIAVPCWFFDRYGVQALQAFGTAVDTGNLTLQDCNGFIDWEELQVLNAVTDDLSAGTKVNTQKAAKQRARSIRLFLAPVAPTASELTALEIWSKKLMTETETRAKRDPLLAEIKTAFALSFYQSYVLLEDYFAAKGYNAADAKGLALAVLQANLGAKTGGAI